MDRLTLYTNPMSRGRTARWMLEELGEPFDVELVNFGPAMKSPEFCAINPMGKVPVLCHGSRIITEVAAICAYLAETFPAAGLAPLEAERADYYRWMFFAAGPLEAALSNRALGFVVPADKEGMIGYGTYDNTIQALELAVSKSDFITGNRFTAADIYVGAHIGWGMMFGTLPAKPAFVSYWDRIKSRPALARASAADDAALAAQ